MGVIFIDSLVRSYNQLIKNWKLIPAVAALDFVFLLLFGITTNRLSISLQKPFAEIVNVATSLTGEISAAVQAGKSSLSVLLSYPEILLNVKTLFLVLFAFIFIVYTIWIALNGSSWYLAYAMLESKQKFKFLKFNFNFAKVSLILVGLLNLISLVLIRFSLFALLRPEQILGSSIILGFSSFLNYILFYFIVISLSFIPYTKPFENVKKTLKYGIKELPNFLIAFLIIGVVLWINFNITFLLFKPIIATSAELTASVFAITVLRFLIAAPFLTWARMYLMDMCKSFN